MFDWQKFFQRAGVPSAAAGRYASNFKHNRITLDVLPELDKQTLQELGVSVIGDQLAILRSIKDGDYDSHHPSSQESVPEKRTQAPKIKMRISGPASFTADDLDYASASTHRKGRPPPDRHEIYHVKMPEGNTHRTKQIMNRHDQLRRHGLSVRGTTGVRQAGRSVSPIDKNSEVARHIRQRDSAVSSTSDSVINRLGVRGLHSDVAKGRSGVVMTGRVVKRVVTGNVLARTSVASSRQTITSRIQKPLSARIRVPEEPPRRQAGSNAIQSRLSGSTLSRVTVNVGSGSRVVSAGGGRQNQRQQRSVQSRLSGVKAARANVVVDEVYQDEVDAEYMDDDMEDIYEDDNMLDPNVYEDDGYVEYVEAPRGDVFNRLSK